MLPTRSSEEPKISDTKTVNTAHYTRSIDDNAHFGSLTETGIVFVRFKERERLGCQSFLRDLREALKALRILIGDLREGLTVELNAGEL